MAQIKDIISAFNEAFPPKLAETWDNVGLQIGDPNASVQKVLLCLELTPRIVQEAIDCACGLVIAHHPLIFKPLLAVTRQDPVASMLMDMLEAGIGLFVAHTNCDAGTKSISQYLAHSLKLKRQRFLLPKKHNTAYKLVLYTPESDSDRVVDALHDAGAGRIGNYHHVSFRAKGTGRFSSTEHAKPAIGSAGSSESVREEKAELIVDDKHLHAVIDALYTQHPYEEPAFDLYRLENKVNGINDQFGYGCIGELDAPRSLAAFITELKSAWMLNSVRFCGDSAALVQKIAILNGSGAKFLLDAKAAGADVFITGDCSHHDFDGALRYGISLIDAGHYETERCVVDVFADVLQSHCATRELSVLKSACMQSPMHAG
ncbi:MAG: Nif3-like dinuclear metal center hexameric protein [Bradymonadales bacterium]|jgi:dinuclear metal center YbgI/SA1388 family protein